MKVPHVYSRVILLAAIAFAGCSDGNDVTMPTVELSLSVGWGFGSGGRSTEEGGGWAGSGLHNVMWSDTLSRDGGWVGSGH